MLVVSDIIPSDVAASTDALALLRFGAENGFFIAAVLGLVRTVLSDYWRLRTRYGLTRYGEAAMTENSPPPDLPHSARRTISATIRRAWRSWRGRDRAAQTTLMQNAQLIWPWTDWASPRRPGAPSPR